MTTNRPFLSTIKRISVHVLTLIFSIPVLGAMAINAQTTGTIYGKVTDAEGASITEAKVIVKNVATNLIRTASTDDHGDYQLTLLPAGLYHIEVEANGFKPYSIERVELHVEQHVRADFRLEVGQIHEQVVVTAETSQVDSASSTLGKAVEGRRIIDLPLNGRNFLQLGVLQPGVTPPAPGIDSFGSRVYNDKR
jgi:hypothetical protein